MHASIALDRSRPQESRPDHQLENQMKHCLKHLYLLSLLVLPGMGVSASEGASIEEVVVTGARGKPRTVSDSPVPVDVFDSDAINDVAYTDTNDVLMTLVPSYSLARQPISDGATFIRPASLRGMPTDKTLVLVNSKRRHRAALVSIGASGTQGPDIATIPTVALQSVEVLRDGAAAQYGSDAIAGVINFILKENNSGGMVTFDAGSYYEGDGDMYTISGNIGLPLGENGFLSLSGEYNSTDRTIRAEQYCESWFCLDPSNPVYDPTAWYATYTEDPTFMAAVADAGKVVQPWGQPKSDSGRLFFNAGYTFSDKAEVYAFGNYSKSSADGNFFYRYPYNGTIEPIRQEDGSVWWPLDIYPGGFTPQFFGDVTDYSIVSGLRGSFDSGFTYDLSARYGYDEISYTLKNTINPSLGPDTPQSFKPGDLINEETQVQADFTYEFGMGLAAPAVFAFGVSYLDESYEVVEGEPSSYVAGPYALQDPWGFCDNGTPTASGLGVAGLDCANPDDPVYTVVGVGSNGFPGFSPEFSEKYSRDSWAVYGDLSVDVTDKLFLQGAVRYEDYSDFGSETVGKFAGIYKFTDNIALRGSYGTGFRAPTPGQQGTTNVSTRLPNGFPVATGLFPASSTVSEALGATPLQPEKSKNYTLGMTFSFDVMDVTVDFYRIDVTDRVYSISTLDVSTDPTSGSAYDNYLALVGAGVAGAESIGGVFYFTNAFDTKTEGVDVVATIPVQWSNSTTEFMISGNYNKTRFTSDPSAYLNAEDQYDFEHFDPEWRGVLSATHFWGDLSFMARINVYGPWENYNAGQVQKYDTQAYVDLEARYQFNPNLTFALGGRNVFDEYPDKDEIGDYCCGRLYSSGTVVPWQGGYYYLKAVAAF